MDSLPGQHCSMYFVPLHAAKSHPEGVFRAAYLFNRFYDRCKCARRNMAVLKLQVLGERLPACHTLQPSYVLKNRHWNGSERHDQQHTGHASPLDVCIQVLDLELFDLVGCGGQFNAQVQAPEPH